MQISSHPVNYVCPNHQKTSGKMAGKTSESSEFSDAM